MTGDLHLTCRHHRVRFFLARRPTARWNLFRSVHEAGARPGRPEAIGWSTVYETSAALGAVRQG